MLSLYFVLLYIKVSFFSCFIFYFCLFKKKTKKVNSKFKISTQITKNLHVTNKVYIYFTKKKQYIVYTYELFFFFVNCITNLFTTYWLYEKNYTLFCINIRFMKKKNNNNNNKYTFFGVALRISTLNSLE